MRIERVTEKNVQRYSMRICALVTQYYQESNYSERTWDLDYMQACVQAMAEHPQEIDMFLVLSGHTIVGFLLAEACRSWYSPDLLYNEHLLIVNQDVTPMQRALAVMKLCKLVQERAVKRGARAVTMGTSTGSNTEAYLKLLHKQGFTTFGHSVKKELGG